MRPTVTRNATHNFQPPANWVEERDGPCGDLQVRAETFGDQEIIELFSTWKPDENELSLLNQGCVIEIGICSSNQPVMQVGVVLPVEPALLKYVAPQLDEPPDGALPNVSDSLLTINEDGHGT